MAEFDEKMSQAETGHSSSTPSLATQEVLVDEFETPSAPTKNNQTPEQSRSPQQGSWVKWAVVAVASAGVVATGVGVPLAMRDGSNNDNSGTEPIVYVPPFEEADDELPPLSDKVLEPYVDVAEFKQAMTLVAYSYVNGVVGKEVGDKLYASFGAMDRMWVGTAADDGALEMGASRDSTTATNSDNINDYDTNNQESDVNEGDRVLTDGEIGIAVKGPDSIVAWNVSDGSPLLDMQIETDSEVMQPYIHTLMLNGDALIVVARGFGYEAQQQEQRVLSGYNDTKILFYDFTTIGEDPDELELLAERTVHGEFVTIRAIDTNIHVVMANQLQMYHFLVSPFSRQNNQMLAELDTEGYTQEARKIADATVVPDFVDRLAAELTECGQLPKMVKMNRWTTQEKSDQAMDHFLYSGGYAESFVSVVSVDVLAITNPATPDPVNCVAVSGSMFPANAWDVKVYASKERLIMAVKGYDYSTEREMTIDSTFLLAFDLNDAEASPIAVGNVDGYILGQYSFRVDGSTLELATTIRQQWFWVRPMMVIEPGVRRGRHLQTGGEISNIPTTENYIITMDLEAGNGEMVELDRLALGKEGEVFTTVRFFPDVAYAVTFRQMDPFYVVNTTDPTNINVTGILDNITGWSNYLEPMNADNTVMLAIGQEANDRGAPIGVSISVFDARDLDDVKLSARFLLASTTNPWSSDSEALREKDAIRFNPETGFLIIPITLNHYADGYFRGFRVFDVLVDEITEKERCAMDLSAYKYSETNSWSGMASRSMIISGSYMATMGKFIAMRDLDTCELDWDASV